MDEHFTLPRESLATDAAQLDIQWVLQDPSRIFEYNYSEVPGQGGLSPTESQLSYLTRSSRSSHCDMTGFLPPDNMTFPQFCEQLVYDAETVQNAYHMPEAGHETQYDTPGSVNNGERTSRKKGRPLASSPQDMSAKATKRREQNRVAQRTYRARKDDQISQMELRLAELTMEAQYLNRENKLLLAEVKRLKSAKNCLEVRDYDYCESSNS